LSRIESEMDIFLDFLLSVRRSIDTPAAIPAKMQNMVIGMGLGNSAKIGASIEANLAKKLHIPKVVEE
ncbi:MAG: hypothetical protein ACKO96_03600, partial [Flammeovirgaceae bacterium]